MRIAKQLLVAAGLLGLLSFCLTGCGRNVAKVNGDKISRKEYYDRLEKMTINVGSRPQQVGEVVLQQLIQERLKLQLADREKSLATDEQVDKRLDMLKRLNRYQPLKDSGFTDDDIRKAARIDQSWMNFITKGVTVKEKECKDYYDKQKDTPAFTTPAHIQWGVIAALTEKKAKRLSNQLRMKGQEFTTVAMRQSDIAELRARGGSMDPVPADVPANLPLPPSVRQLLKTMKVGQISAPVYVPPAAANERGAWFIIKIVDRRPKETKRYIGVRDMIREQLLLQKAARKYAVQGRKQGLSPDIKYQNFVKKSEVKIDIRRYTGLWQRTLSEIDYQEEARASANATSPTAAP